MLLITLPQSRRPKYGAEEEDEADDDGSSSSQEVSMAGMTAANANRQSVFRIFIVLKGFGLMVIEQNYNEGNRIYCNGKNADKIL